MTAGGPVFNGDVVWKTKLDGRNGFGSPMTFTSPSRRPMIVLATSKSQGEDATLMDFALPTES